MDSEDDMQDANDAESLNDFYSGETAMDSDADADADYDYDFIDNDSDDSDDTPVHRQQMDDSTKSNTVDEVESHFKEGQMVPPQPPPKANNKDNIEGRRQRSVVWKYFTKLECEQRGKAKASCNLCGATYACDANQNGTTSMLSHLKFQCIKSPIRIEDNSQSILKMQPKKDIESSGSGGQLVAVGFSVEACRKALVEMLIVDELPYKFVENEGFRNFMHVVCPRWDKISSRLTVAKDCLSLFTKEKMKLKSALKGQRLCLTTDTWTSVQNLNYMCLTAHFIDNDWKLHKRLINFCLVENHKGETLGKATEMCLLGWGIDKTLTITVDNASSNNGLIHYLKKKTKYRRGTILEHEFLHVRCCAHILNLIVCEGLKEMDDSIIKVRNVVRYVRSSPSRMTTFKLCAEKEGIIYKGSVCLDVSTRWNSTYMMLDRAEKFQKAFERLEEEDLNYLPFFRYGESDEEGEGNLSGKGRGKDKKKFIGPPNNDDWDKVRMFVPFLKLFYDATLRFSGSLILTSNAFFEEFILIQTSIETMCRNDNLFLSSMAYGMKKKFDKYWGNFDSINLLLFVAVVLDPRYKLKYVSFCFGEMYESILVNELTKKVKDSFTSLFDWYVSNDASNIMQSQDSTGSSGKVVHDTEKDVRSQLASRYKKHLDEEDMMGSKSEVEKYLAETCEPEQDKFDVLVWWKSNSFKYPIISKIARDVLAIPVSTVASESAFSTGGRVLDSFRSSLSPNTVEALICLQNWIRSSSTQISLSDAMDDVEEFERIETELGDVNLLDLTTVED